MAYRNYGPSVGFVVDPNGHGDFTTIGAALTAATTGTTIFINPGTYTENLTLKTGVYFAAIPDCMVGATGHVKIFGKIIDNGVAVASSFIGIEFHTNGDYVLSLTAASSIVFTNCFFRNFDFTVFNSTNASAITYLYSCTGNMTSAHGLWSISNGTLNMYNTVFQNQGAVTTAPTLSGGAVVAENCVLPFPIACTSSGAYAIRNCTMDCSTLNTAVLTTAGTGTSFVDMSRLFSGTASAISIGAGTTANVTFADLNSSNANVLTGAGTLNYGGIVFTGSSSGHNVSTENPYATLN